MTNPNWNFYQSGGQLALRDPGGQMSSFGGSYNFNNAGSPMPSVDVSASGVPNAGPSFFDRAKNAAKGMYSNVNTARTAGTAQARSAIANAGTRAAAVSKAIAPAMKFLGPAVSVLGGGLETKDRLDRGEDGQRAVQGGLASTVGGIFGGGLGMLSGPFAPIVAPLASMAGSAVAGFVNDRVTDAVRGNDGKSTGKIAQDLDGQIDQAIKRNDPYRAQTLMKQRDQLVAQRDKLSNSPSDNSTQVQADRYSVRPEAMGALRDAQNEVGLSNYVYNNDVDRQLKARDRAEREGFGRNLEFNYKADPLAARIALRNSEITQRNNAASEMAATTRQSVTNASSLVSDMMRNIYSNGR